MSANRYLTGATAVTDLGNFTVSGQLPLGYRGSSYQLETDVSWSDAQNIGLQLRVSGWNAARRRRDLRQLQLPQPWAHSKPGRLRDQTGNELGNRADLRWRLGRTCCDVGPRARRRKVR